MNLIPLICVWSFIWNVSGNIFAYSNFYLLNQISPNLQCGAALASQLNVDLGIESYFEGSGDEPYYGEVRLQPLAFQDDISRLATSTMTAQVGNIKLSTMMKEKQLECHPDKTGYIVMGTEKFKEKVEKETCESPLVFGDFEVKEKKSDKYLGDWFDGRGLAESVETTIKAREGMVKTAIMEVSAIIDDFRMQAIGGIMAGFEL